MTTGDASMRRATLPPHGLKPDSTRAGFLGGTVVVPYQDDGDVYAEELEECIPFDPWYVAARSPDAAQEALLNQVADQLGWPPELVCWDADSGAEPLVTLVDEPQQLYLMGMPMLPGWEEPS